MKEFTINNYLEDIRKKIPAYDLMLKNRYFTNKKYFSNWWTKF